MKKHIKTICKILSFFFVWAILSTMIDIPSDNPAIWRFFAELIPLIIIIICTIIFTAIEKNNVKVPIINNIRKGSLTGFIVGVLWISTVYVFLFLNNFLAVTQINMVDTLWLWIISAFINVIMQELLVRGYIYQLLKTNYNLPLAVIVTSVMFTLLHAAAFEAGIIPVVNVLTMFLFTTALYESQETLLAPIMSHAVWNIEGSILLGGVKLAQDYPSICSTVSFGNTWISGGDYKIEASIIVTVLNIILTIILFLKNKRKKIN